MVRWILAVAALLLALPALAGSITLRTEDGVTLRGAEYGGGTRGVVLVHGEGRSAGDWTWLAEKLATRGHRVVAVDLRGHGESDGSVAEEDWSKMVADVRAAVAHLRGRGATELVLVGSRVGANLALNAAAVEPAVTGLVLVSPGMNLHGVPVKQALIDYGPRPLLVLASEEDTYAAKTGLFLTTLANGDKHLELAVSGAGTRMVNRDLELENLLVAWIGGTWRQTTAAPARTVDTRPTSEIETTGVKFGEE